MIGNVAECCPPCPVVSVNVPGSPGTNGTNGAAGSPGDNAWTLTTANFTLPAVGANVTPVQVANSNFIVVGQNLFISDGTTQGNFQVVAFPAANQLTLKFLGYLGDGTTGTAINSGAKVSPSGLQGPAPLVLVTEITTGTVLFTPNAAAKALFVECIGGGGSGGGVGTAATNAGAGGGGGSGAYSCVFLSSVAASYTVAVGPGGTAPAAGSNPGNAGGDTTFGAVSVCTAKGGSGGGADTVGAGPRIAGLGGAGGSSGSGVGDAVFNGTAGGNGIALAAAQASSGVGATGPLGGGAAGITTQNNGNAGGQYGSGGSGGCILSGGASVAGGAGANGLIRVWQFS